MMLVVPSNAPFTVIPPAIGTVGSSSPALSVLLIDIASADVAQLRWILEATGCDVVEGYHQQLQPDVVITGETGIEQAREIASRAKLRQPFVVAVTAPGGEPLARSAGVHLTIPRPIDFRRLAGMLARFRSLLAGVEGFDPAI